MKSNYNLCDFVWLYKQDRSLFYQLNMQNVRWLVSGVNIGRSWGERLEPCRATRNETICATWCGDCRNPLHDLRGGHIPKQVKDRQTNLGSKPVEQRCAHRADCVNLRSDLCSPGIPRLHLLLRIRYASGTPVDPRTWAMSRSRLSGRIPRAVCWARRRPVSLPSHALETALAIGVKTNLGRILRPFNTN